MQLVIAGMHASVVIPGPPALFAGGTGNLLFNEQRKKDSGLPRYKAGAAPGMTTIGKRGHDEVRHKPGVARTCRRAVHQAVSRKLSSAALNVWLGRIAALTFAMSGR